MASPGNLRHPPAQEAPPPAPIIQSNPGAPARSHRHPLVPAQAHSDQVAPPRIIQSKTLAQVLLAQVINILSSFSILSIRDHDHRSDLIENVILCLKELCHATIHQHHSFY